MANKCSSVPKFDRAELSPDLLPFIAHKLGDAIDFICFRAMCKKWRLAEVCFHALPSGKIFFFSFPNHRDYSMAYNCKGSNEFQFYEIDEECNHKYFIKKFVAHNQLGLNVINGRDQLEISLAIPVGNISKFVYSLLSGKVKRLLVATPFMRFAHYRGRNFKFGDGPRTVVDVIDSPTGKTLSTISRPVEVTPDSNLISTRDGLLMLSKKYVQSRDQDDKPYYDYQFVVHRLENYDTKHPNWIKLSGIGDMMLFLDHKNAFSLMATQYGHDGFRGNCIYFITRLKRNPTCSSWISRYQYHYVLAGFDVGESRSFEVCSLGEYTMHCMNIYWLIPLSSLM